MWQQSEYHQFARKLVYFISVIIDMRRRVRVCLKHSHMPITGFFEACRSLFCQQVCQGTVTWFTIFLTVNVTSDSLHERAVKRWPHFITGQRHKSEQFCVIVSQNVAACHNSWWHFFLTLHSCLLKFGEEKVIFLSRKWRELRVWSSDGGGGLA